VICRILMLLLIATASAALLPFTAAAGTYNVTACHNDTVNRSWEGYRSNGYADAMVDCTPRGTPPTVDVGMVARNTGGPGKAPYYSHAGLSFYAPPGARIVRVSGQVRANSSGGWTSGLFDETSGQWSYCCNTFMTWQPLDVPVASASRVSLRVFCAQAECARDAIYGYASLRYVTVTVADDGAPRVAMSGGSLLAGKWQRGVRDVVVSASDPVGIRRVGVYVDGVRASEHDHACDPSRPVQCPNDAEALTVDTRTLGDGQHTLLARGTDSAGNASTASRTIWTDNTAPAAPQGLAPDGGSGWKGTNEFRLRWRDPAERYAPVAAAVVTICPLLQEPVDPRRCARTASRSASSKTSSIHVPGRGQWRAYVWLQDAAGNSNPTYAATTVLRFDDSAPTVSIRPQSPDEPAVVQVRARDSLAPIAVREVLIRRRGRPTWISLPTTPTRDGFSAFVDDERLDPGVYDVRARAVDEAGNERTVERREDGTPAQLALPLRIRTRLAVGRPRRVRARGANGKRRYRIVLVERPRTRFGHTIPLRGRLTSPGGNPLAGREVVVSERTKVPGARWRPLATLRTSRAGRFTFRALRGPSRTLRFRFGGAATIRGRTALVRLGVRATTSVRVDRRTVVNGEAVVFRGRVRGHPLPTSGKLVELQARTRGGWRTFATPRASARSGAWSYAYRFSATRGSVRYRFRAFVPKESGFPYESGASRTVRVRVRGL
jgi:hypothetical protein